MAGAALVTMKSACAKGNALCMPAYEAPITLRCEPLLPHLQERTYEFGHFPDNPVFSLLVRNMSTIWDE